MAVGSLLWANTARAATVDAPQTGFDVLGFHLSSELSAAAFVAPLVGIVGYGAWVYQKIGVSDATFLVISSTLTRLEDGVSKLAAGQEKDMETLTAAIAQQGKDFTVKLKDQEERLTAKIEKQGADLTAKIEKQGADLTAKIEKQGDDLTAKIDKQTAELRIDLDGKLNILRADIRALDEKFDRKFDRLGQDVSFLRGVRTERQRQTQANVDT